VKRYRVLLPVDIDGVIYGFGAIVELSAETAKDYSHALVALAEEEDGGSHS
jgi:hypothetical protein